MKKIQFDNNKILKLTNVLQYKIMVGNDFNFNAAIEQMQTYIKTQGAMPVGPLIQYTETIISDSNVMDVEMVMMMQCNVFLNNVVHPYSMEKVIRVPNAYYCRYAGPEHFLRYAYEKINIEAFENDDKLKSCNYTIFINNNNRERDIIMADIFVPRAENL